MSSIQVPDTRDVIGIVSVDITAGAAMRTASARNANLHQVGYHYDPELGDVFYVVYSVPLDAEQ